MDDSYEFWVSFLIHLPDEAYNFKEKEPDIFLRILQNF